MKQSSILIIAVVVVLVAVVGYLAYSQSQLQARMDQQQRDSAAALAQQQKQSAAALAAVQQALEDAKRPKYEHRTDSLTPSMLTVPSAQVEAVKIAVDSAVMKDAKLTGRFTASGGNGDGIEVFVFDQDNFVNWSHGSEFRSLFKSGLKTVGNVDTVSLDKSGTYYLVFSNKRAIFYDRTVSADMKLDYDKRVN